MQNYLQLNPIDRAVYGFMTSHTLFSLEKLGVFDILIKLGSASLEDLAKNTNTDTSALKRLLLAGVAIDLLDIDGHFNYFIPHALKSMLDKRNSSYIAGGFGHYRDITTQLFFFLDFAIKENAPQWKKIYPESRDLEQFSEVYRSREDTKIFMDSMWGIGYPASKEILTKFSLENYNTLVDIGGASGSFSIAALEENSKLIATILDLSAVEEHLAEKAKFHEVQNRLFFCCRDMFKDPFPKAEAYSLGYILSDWSREDGTFLLKKIYDALPANGIVLVLEKLFDEDKKGPIPTAMMNLVMLLEMYGCHYSASEYHEWLESVGFKNCMTIRSSGEKHMIVGYKQSVESYEH